MCIVAMNTLSACTVPYGSVLGLSLNDAGAVLAVAGVCSGHLDSVSVTSTNSETVYLTKDFVTRVDEVGTVPLTGADGLGLQNIVGPSGTSLLRADTSDASWQAAGPAFTEQDLAALEVGRVWFQGWDEQEQTTAYRSVPIDTFRSEGCADRESVNRAP